MNIRPYSHEPASSYRPSAASYPLHAVEPELNEADAARMRDLSYELGRANLPVHAPTYHEGLMQSLREREALAARILGPAAGAPHAVVPIMHAPLPPPVAPASFRPAPSQPRAVRTRRGHPAASASAARLAPTPRAKPSAAKVPDKLSAVKCPAPTMPAKTHDSASSLPRTPSPPREVDLEKGYMQIAAYHGKSLRVAGYADDAKWHGMRVVTAAQSAAMKSREENVVRAEVKCDFDKIDETTKEASFAENAPHGFDRRMATYHAASERRVAAPMLIAEYVARDLEVQARSSSLGIPEALPHALRTLSRAKPERYEDEARALLSSLKNAPLLHGGIGTLLARIGLSFARGETS